MNRLPQDGDFNWGQTLNRFLSQSLDNSNGGAPNSFAAFSERPTGLTSADAGKTLLYVETGNLHSWDGAAWQVLHKSEANVKDFGAIGDGMADDTAAIQAAVNTGRTVFIPKGGYRVTGSVIISPHQRITGESRETSVLITEHATEPIFKYLSPLESGGYDIHCSLIIENLRFFGRNHVQLNQSGDFATVFSRQGHLLNVRIIHCTFVGAYNPANDPDANTAAYPTDAELAAFGVGIRLAKVFDSLIQNCYFQSCGLAVRLDGCDINNIDTCRFMVNARHVHIDSHDTYGYQNKIQNCDILSNYRRGGIYDTASFTSIKDNYFGTYSPAAEHVVVRGGQGQLIWGNRFDTSRHVTPIMSLAPAYGCIVSGNRINPASPPAAIEVLPTYYSPGVAGIKNTAFVKFSGNSTTLQEPVCLWCEYDSNNPRLFDAFNPKVISGVKSTAFPFGISPVTGKPSIRGGPDSLYIYMATQRGDLNLAIRITALSVGGAAGFMIVAWGGAEVWRGYWGLTNSSALQTVTRTLRKPDGVTPDSGLTFEVVTSEFDLHAVEVAPVECQLLEAAPNAGTWQVGERVIKATPTVGQPTGWRCTASGTPGTWIAESNL